MFVFLLLFVVPENKSSNPMQNERKNKNLDLFTNLLLTSQHFSKHASKIFSIKNTLKNYCL